MVVYLFIGIKAIYNDKINFVNRNAQCLILHTRFLTSVPYFTVPFKDTPKFNPRRRMSVLERSASSVNSTSPAVASHLSGTSINSKRPNSSITSSPANSSIASNNSSLSAATNTTGIGSINGSTGGGASALSSPHSQNQHNAVHQNYMQNPHFS